MSRCSVAGVQWRAIPKLDTDGVWLEQVPAHDDDELYRLRFDGVDMTVWAQWRDVAEKIFEEWRKQ